MALRDSESSSEGWASATEGEGINDTPGGIETWALESLFRTSRGAERLGVVSQGSEGNFEQVNSA